MSEIHLGDIPGADHPAIPPVAPSAAVAVTAVEHTPAARDFADRHIGPRGAETLRMLETVGYPTLDALVDAVVPAAIRTGRWTTSVAELTGAFARLLRPAPHNAGLLEEWITAVRDAEPPHLHAFTRGLDFDKNAVRAALTLPFHNSGTEGVNTKTKQIMRQMHGRAGFALLCHRTLLN